MASGNARRGGKGLTTPLSCGEKSREEVFASDSTEEGEESDNA